MAQLSVSDIHEIIEQLRAPDEFPAEAIELLGRHWIEAAPLLLEAVEDDIQSILDQLPAPSPEAYSDEDQLPQFDDLLFQAVYLFGQFRYAPAFSVLLRVLDLPLETGILGDFQFEGLPRCLAACAGGDPEKLRAVLADVEVEESSRVVAWDALQCMAVWGELGMEVLLEDLGRLLSDPRESENEFLVDVLVNSVARLPVDEPTLSLARSIAKGSRKGGGIASIEEFEAERSRFREETWREDLGRTECPRVEDAAAEIEPWFSAQADDELDEDGYDADGNWIPPEPIEQLRSDKVGRNDPCLCGSGLKHKKCCGKNS